MYARLYLRIEYFQDINQDYLHTLNQTFCRSIVETLFTINQNNTIDQLNLFGQKEAVYHFNSILIPEMYRFIYVRGLVRVFTGRVPNFY